MPYLKKYKGRPVTRSRQVSDGIEITFANAKAGEIKQRTVISQYEWDTHGTSEFVDKTPNLRELARQYEKPAR